AGHRLPSSARPERPGRPADRRRPYRQRDLPHRRDRPGHRRPAHLHQQRGPQNAESGRAAHREGAVPTGHARRAGAAAFRNGESVAGRWAEAVTTSDRASRPDRPIRVLVVDDSAFMRKMLSEILASAPELEVVGTARDGEDALEKLRALQPDVITLD